MLKRSQMSGSPISISMELSLLLLREADRQCILELEEILEVRLRTQLYSERALKYHWKHNWIKKNMLTKTPLRKYGCKKDLISHLEWDRNSKWPLCCLGVVGWLWKCGAELLRATGRLINYQRASFVLWEQSAEPLLLLNAEPTVSKHWFGCCWLLRPPGVPRFLRLARVLPHNQASCWFRASTAHFLENWMEAV